MSAPTTAEGTIVVGRQAVFGTHSGIASLPAPVDRRPSASNPNLVLNIREYDPAMPNPACPEPLVPSTDTPSPSAHCDGGRIWADETEGPSEMTRADAKRVRMPGVRKR